LPLVNLWKDRSSILHFALLNIKIRFKNTNLGILWAAIEPLLYFTVLYVVFTTIRDTGENFAFYLLTGILIYQIFARGTSGGITSLTGNSSILQSLNIRKELFPVITTVAITLLAFVQVGVFFGLMPIFNFVPGWTIILIPIPIILVFFLVLGTTYLLSIINVYVRDVQQLWQIFVHALLFISPIFWYVDEVKGILLEIHKINPLGQLIEISHKLVISQEIPPLSDWLYTSFLIFLIFIVGYVVFQKLESKVIEEL